MRFKKISKPWEPKNSLFYPLFSLSPLSFFFSPFPLFYFYFFLARIPDPEIYRNSSPGSVWCHIVKKYTFCSFGTLSGCLVVVYYLSVVGTHSILTLVGAVISQTAYKTLLASPMVIRFWRCKMRCGIIHV